jgi:hypothetical protein
MNKRIPILDKLIELSRKGRAPKSLDLQDEMNTIILTVSNI